MKAQSKASTISLNAIFTDSAVFVPTDENAMRIGGSKQVRT